MNKSLLSAVILVEMLAGSVCSATIPQSQLEIGGIKYDATISAVESKLGKPDRVKDKTNSYADKIIYHYGDMEVKFVNGKVQEIEVEDMSNYKTAAGIGLGATVADIEKAYGMADYVHKDKYIYYVDGQNVGLTFEMSKSGRVKEIKCGRVD